MIPVTVVSRQCRCYRGSMRRWVVALTLWAACGRQTLDAAGGDVSRQVGTDGGDVGDASADADRKPCGSLLEALRTLPSDPSCGDVPELFQAGCGTCADLATSPVCTNGGWACPPNTTPLRACLFCLSGIIP
jgi:hypothetical protein